MENICPLWVLKKGYLTFFVRSTPQRVSSMWSCMKWSILLAASSAQVEDKPSPNNKRRISHVQQRTGDIFCFTEDGNNCRWSRMVTDTTSTSLPLSWLSFCMKAVEVYDLHWLPISSRIQYKIALICFHIISGTAPPYRSELLHLYSPFRSLRSASDTRIFRVPRMGRRTLGERSFQYIGHVIWNSPPLSVRHSSSL